MAFEEFDPRKTTSAGRGTPVVKLISHGTVLSLNAAAMRLIGDDVRRVTLLFNRDDRELGIRPAAEDDERAFGLNRMPSAGSISAKAFAKEYRLAGGQRWPLEERDGMLVAKVNPLDH